MVKNKRISNPFSTGSGGAFFENQVQSSFVIIMLSEGCVPCLENTKINKILLQGKYQGFNVDDMIIYLEDSESKKQHKMLCQIKHTVDITKTNLEFKDVIKAAWTDFQNVEVFNKDKDYIALITGPLSKVDINDTRIILEWAHYSRDSQEYFQKIYTTHFSSKRKVEKLNVFRHVLQLANKNIQITDEILFEFLKRFIILGYDFDIWASVTRALTHSLIRQNTSVDVNSVWGHISSEIQNFNKNAGIISLEVLPDAIKKYFKPPIKQIIPEKYIKPDIIISPINISNDENLNAMLVATLVGSWNEKNEADIEIIKDLEKDYEQLIQILRSRYLNEDKNLVFSEGIWRVTFKYELFLLLTSRVFDNHLDTLREVILKVLLDVHPKFDLDESDRFASALYGKTSKYSNELRNGLAETLAFIGAYGPEFINCTFQKTEQLAHETVYDILHDADWKVWATLNEVLPLLAEAAPDTFLYCVLESLKNSPGPFDELFKQEGNSIFGGNYLSGLYWALETLAWSEEYLTQTILVFAKLANHDPGGYWSNRPINSITTILLPWFPQTVASIKTRIASLKGINRDYPKTAQEVILNLLPNNHQTSAESCKPVFRKYIPDDYEEKDAAKDYWEQVNAYAEMAVEIAQSDTVFLIKLIENLENIPHPSFTKLLDYLASVEVKKFSEEMRQPIWESMLACVHKHRKHSSAKWALPKELVDKLDEVAKIIEPKKPEMLFKHLFSNRDYEFYEKDLSWDEQSIIFQDKRNDAIKEIFSNNDIERIITFVHDVEDPFKVGVALSQVTSTEIDKNILPVYLDFGNDLLMKHFLRGYITDRFKKHSITWVDSFDFKNWTPHEISNYFLFLPCEDEVWKRAEKTLNKDTNLYWANINSIPYAQKGSLSEIIDKLLKYDRAALALEGIYMHYNSTNEFLAQPAINALLRAVELSDSIRDIDTYQIVEIIKMLQEDKGISEDDLFNVEWAYLSLLDREDIELKSMNKKLSQDPKFFVETIQLVYRSKNDVGKELPVDSSKKNIALQAYKMLEKWTRPPGIQDDGVFSLDHFKEWILYVSNVTSKSGHYESAMRILGQVLFFAPTEPKGLWINKDIIEFLDKEDNTFVRDGYRLKVYNSRGVHWIDPSGKQEKEISEFWKERAKEVENKGFIRFGATLRNLAKSYEKEAERVIHEAFNDGQQESEDDSIQD